MSQTKFYILLDELLDDEKKYMPIINQINEF